MAIVKFLGILRLETKISEMEIQEKYIDDILKSIDQQFDNVNYADLRNAIIFINNKKYKKTLFKRIVIQEKDVLSILFPVAGG